MAQDIKASHLTTGALKQTPDGEKMVRPQDNVTVYATDKTVYVAAGEPMEVHTALADKLIASGKASKTAQVAEKAPKDK